MKTLARMIMISRSPLLRMRNVSEKNVVEKIEAHILCLITSFRKSRRL